MWSESCLPECMGVGWGWGLHFYCHVWEWGGDGDFISTVMYGSGVGMGTSFLLSCMGVGWGWGLHFYCPVIHSFGSKELVLFCRLQVVWLSVVISSLWSLFTSPTFTSALFWVKPLFTSPTFTTVGVTIVHQSSFHLSTLCWVKLFTSPTFTPQPHRGWNLCSPVQLSPLSLTMGETFVHQCLSLTVSETTEEPLVHWDYHWTFRLLQKSEAAMNLSQQFTPIAFLKIGSWTQGNLQAQYFCRLGCWML